MSFSFLHSRARGNRAPGKWPRDGLRTVDRLRSQSGCNGAGGGRAEVGRSFDQPGQVQAAGHCLPGPALLLGLLTGPSALQSLSRAGVGASVCAGHRHTRACLLTRALPQRGAKSSLRLCVCCLYG